MSERRDGNCKQIPSIEVHVHAHPAGAARDTDAGKYTRIIYHMGKLKIPCPQAEFVDAHGAQVHQVLLPVTWSEQPASCSLNRTGIATGWGQRMNSKMAAIRSSESFNKRDRLRSKHTQISVATNAPSHEGMPETFRNFPT